MPKAMTKYIKRICKHCGKEYYITAHRLREHQENGHESNFCSNFCKFEARKTRELKKCPICGRQFYPKNDNKYCSVSCAKEALKKKYPVVDEKCFESLMNRYKKHINHFCGKYESLSSYDEIYEYVLYGIWLEFSYQLGLNNFSFEENSDSGLENFHLYQGMKRGLRMFFREIYDKESVTENIEDVVIPIFDVKSDDNYIQDKVKELSKNINRKTKGMKYLLKIALEGKTIEDISHEEKVPRDIIYNRIYHLKKTINKRCAL